MVDGMALVRCQRLRGSLPLPRDVPKASGGTELVLGTALNLRSRFSCLNHDVAQPRSGTHERTVD